MAVWARHVSRCGCLLSAARAAELPRRLRSGGRPARACRQLARAAALPAGKEIVLGRLPACRQLSVGSRSPPDSVEDGSFSSPESNLPSVQQGQAKPEILPDLNAKILDEGKRL